MLKSAYVSTMRFTGGFAQSIGWLAKLERESSTSRLARWGRSLFAIYQIDEMTKLDLPWWTFDAIERTEAFLRDRPGARIFEYGSGASTIWLARRAAAVTSVEHDPDWHPIVSSKLRDYPHAQVLLVPADQVTDPDPRYHSIKPGWKGRSFRAYVHSIDAVPGLFDLIVIDGRARAACLAHARKRLAPDGMILFDNSHRPAYRRAIADAGMRTIRTTGLTACLPYPDETTLMQPA